jgi:hypothetical protein
MILKTSYRRGGCRALLEYCSRRRHFDVRNRAGNIMTDEEINAFIKKSNEYRFEREILLSPDNHNISPKDFDRKVRESIESWLRRENKYTVDYCYVLHYDHRDHPHVHIILIGEKRDLEMMREDTRGVQELIREVFEEPKLHKGLWLEHQGTLERGVEIDAC